VKNFDFNKKFYLNVYYCTANNLDFELRDTILSVRENSLVRFGKSSIDCRDKNWEISGLFYVVNMTNPEKIVLINNKSSIELLPTL
jgi:hypothetical protein